MDTPVVYTLASRKQHLARHVRTRRRLVTILAVLLCLPAVFLSIMAELQGAHWWDVNAQPVATPAGAWQVSWVGRGLAADAGVKVGDTIVLADGASPQDLNAINQANTLQVVSHNGGAAHMLSWHAPSQFDKLSAISWFILAAVSLLVGIPVFLHATERILAARFFLLMTTVAVASSLEPATVYGNLVAVHTARVLFTGLAVGLLTNFLWLLFFPAHPRERSAKEQIPTRPRQRKHRWLPETLIVTGLIVSTLYFFAVAMQQQQLLDLATTATIFQTALAICISLILIISACFSRRSVTRERARMLIGGMFLGLGPVLAFTVLPLLFENQALVPNEISALALVALPLSFGYAVAKRDLLRADSLIRNTVLTLLTIIGMALAAVFFAELLNPLPAVPALVLGISAGALLAPLMLKAARWIIEAWLFPQVRRYRKLIASGERNERTGLDPQRLAGQLIGEVHLAFPVRQVAVYVPDKYTGQLAALPVEPAGAKTEERASGATTVRSSSPLQSALEILTRYQPLFLDEVASAKLSRTGAPLLVAPENKEPDSEREYWHLLIPMRVHGRLVGVLALSRREDDQAYSDTDRQLSRVLANRKALALDYSLLYADLHAAYEQRRELDAAKDRFIVTAHHELRTPLTGVMGYLELLRELGPAGREARPTDVDIFLNNACRSAEELTAQLESMLTAAEASFTSRQIDLRPVRIGAVVHHAMNTLEGQARAGSHRVFSRIPEEMMALADEEALYRVLLNLLSNSLKYSAEGRPVIFDMELPSEVSEGQIVWASPPAKDYPVVNVVVRDWGNGIPRKQQPMIFERFMRLDHDLNSPIRGTGLGLSICYQLTVSMGGGLGVWSEGITGKGSLFVVQLSSVEKAQEPTARSFGDTHI